MVIAEGLRSGKRSLNNQHSTFNVQSKKKARERFSFTSAVPPAGLAQIKPNGVSNYCCIGLIFSGMSLLSTS